ncbi:carbonic anhydrase [Streptomyces lunalinharesii]|uniref:carbonic anhydrase n=1 Tax=Streptomyces lunalinharesii TaxID=333384 RepID=A0ABN3S0Z7_9ACTN
MSNFAPYLERNQAFAASGAQADVPQIPFVPFKQLYLIICIDPRVEPAAVLGARLGEAIVARNIGGRTTPAVIKDLAWIVHLHENKTPDADWFEIAVIHHTDCGSGLLADDDLRAGYAARGGWDEQTSLEMAVLDPSQTVQKDVATLRSAPELASSIDHIKIGGYAYDLDTGKITTVVPPD